MDSIRTVAIPQQIHLPGICKESTVRLFHALCDLHIVSGLCGAMLFEPAACSAAAAVVQLHYSTGTKSSFKSVGVGLSLTFVLFGNTTEKYQVVILNYTMKQR